MNGSKTVLIDCENLSSGIHFEAAGRWRGFDRIELFGRESLMAPWRAALDRRAMSVACETPVAEDAPSQAADRIMSARAAELAGPADTGGRPALVIIASNDRGFDSDIARLQKAGLAAARQGTPSAPEILALVVGELAVDGWAAAAGVGDHLARRFKMSLRGRAEELARAAGLETRLSRQGLAFRAPTPRS